MARQWAIFPALLMTAAAAGCGGDDPQLTETERMVRTADNLTLEAAELQADLAAAAVEVAEGSTQGAPESTLDALEDRRGRAEDIAERAREELPYDIPVRDELQSSGEQLVDAADHLSTYADTADEEALADAHSTLATTERLTASAAEQLADRPPQELRELLDLLRRLRPVAPPL